jgi:hypothetical protein
MGSCHFGHHRCSYAHHTEQINALCGTMQDSLMFRRTNRYRSALTFQYKESMAVIVLIPSCRPCPVIGRLLTDRVQMCCMQRTRKCVQFRPSLFHNNISMVQWSLCTQITFSGTNDWCGVSTAHLCFAGFSKWSSWQTIGNFSHS